MDWELYERYRSTLLLAGLLLVASLLLGFQRTSVVLHFRSLLVRFTLPPQQFLSQMNSTPAVATAAPETPAVSVPVMPESPDEFLGEERRKIRVLTDENQRLREA